MDMKLRTAFMSGLLSERINSLIDVLENSEDCSKYSIEEIRDALSKTIDILKAIVGYIEINTVSSAPVSNTIECMLQNIRDDKGLEVLNKLRAEIEGLDGKYLIGDYGIYGENIPKYVRLWDVLQIITKYKEAESGE